MHNKYISDPLFKRITIPSFINGFPSFSSATEGDGFKSDFYENIASSEEGNFWFIGRNRFILWALKKYAPTLETFLEIGCGTGYVLSGVGGAFPNARLYGSELFSAGLPFASKRLPRATFMQMDARNLPFTQQLDVIGAFDVLEHIEQDVDVLNQVHKSLKPNGTLIITVPQHQWLWSGYDDYSCHVRRYERRDLHAKVESAGFSILRSTSFVSSLLPAMMAARLMSKEKLSKGYDAGDDLKINPTLNSLFKQFLSAELAAVRAGINLPVGGSRLLVARKR
jgi:SAM-dependent methyltransferase